jgi:hypothetical protein
MSCVKALCMVTGVTGVAAEVVRRSGHISRRPMRDQDIELRWAAAEGPERRIDRQRRFFRILEGMIHRLGFRPKMQPTPTTRHHTPHESAKR